VSSEGANQVVKDLAEKISSKDFIGTKVAEGLVVADAGDFSYTDLDGSVSKNQGLYVKFEGGARIVVRLSGTGSSGATIRLYVERYESDKSVFSKSAEEYLGPTIDAAVKFLQLQQYIGREHPDVKT
jgi:phosphoglucomutase